jgi:L-fuconolactonase
MALGGVFPADWAAVTVIDAHHHVWDLAVRHQPWLADPERAAIRRTFTIDELRPVAAAAGVTATVLVQTVTDAGETPEMLALAAGDPLIRAVVGWTDLTAPKAADELARLAGGPGGDRLAGIRHVVQAEPDPDWLRRPAVLGGLRAVAGAGLAYDLIVQPHQLGAAAFAAQSVPELTFVLDHCGNPPESGDLESWVHAVRALARCPNTVCKLSGLATEPGAAAVTAAQVTAAQRTVADVVLSAFGADRVMYGSDWPVCLLASDYPGVIGLARVLTAGLSAAEQAAVFAGTAARVYRITTS